MRRDVAQDLSRSARALLSVVWPSIRKAFGGGDLLPVESTDDKGLRGLLDMLAGIDAWHIHLNGMRAIASRVQFGPNAWESFTIRKRRPNGASTEWEKRRRALLQPDEGWLAPHLVIQAYVSMDERQLLYAAVVRAADLYALATDELRDAVWTPRTNSDDGVEFAAFWVTRMREYGVEVMTFGRATHLAPQHCIGLNDYDLPPAEVYE